MEQNLYFDDVSPDWDTMRKSFFPDRIRELTITAAGIQFGSVVADIGAGSGFITEGLLPMNSWSLNNTTVGWDLIVMTYITGLLRPVSMKFQ